MALTNSEFVRDVLGMIGVLRISQTPDANQSAQALRGLNDMLFEWQARGIDLEYSSQSDPSEDFPLDETLLEVIKTNLAVRMCPYYEREPSQVLAAVATSGYARLERDAALAAQQESKMSNMPMDEGRQRNGSKFGISILTGE